MLTLTNVAEKPELLSFGVQTPIESTLRPLTPSDEPELVAFFKSLTVRSRLFFSLSEDLTRKRGIDAKASQNTISSGL